MGEAFSAADLALARSGAAVLGELPRFGLPAILVPYPHAWRYQHVNASYLESHGAALVVGDDKLAEELPGLLSSLLEEEGRLERMRSASRALDVQNAAGVIAENLERLIEDRSAEHG